MPRPAQHSASLPSITTAGTERMPSSLARFATSTSRMSWTITSHEGQAARLMTSMASWQAAHPALNTSIFRVAAISFGSIYLGPARAKRSPRATRRQTLPLGGTSQVKGGVAGLKREAERDGSRCSDHFYRPAWATLELSRRRRPACLGHDCQKFQRFVREVLSRVPLHADPVD